MKVISIGDLVLDYYYKEGKLLGVNGGMSSHNIIANLSNFGMETKVIGACGNDIQGDIAIKSLDDLNVDVYNIDRFDVHTRCFHINNLEHSFTSKKKCPICLKKHWYENSLIESEKVLKLINKDDILILDNLNLVNREIISKSNNKIMLDLGQYYELDNYSDEDIKGIFKNKFEIVNLNERVEKYLVQRFDNIEFIKANLIIITKGSKGADFIYKNKLIHKDIVSSKEIDSNGAGDAFFATIIYKYLNKNFNIDDAYDEATKVTSKVVKCMGARGHLSNLYKVKKVKNECTCNNFELRKKPNRCSLNLHYLESRILSALDTKAFKTLQKVDFDKLNNALFVGTGGSYAGALFASKVINKLYGVITIPIWPRNVLYFNTEKVDKVFMFSYSGTTNDLLEGTKNISNDKKVIITKGKKDKVFSKTGINNIVSYYSSTNKGKEKGFLSFEGAVVPATLFLNLYYKDISGLVKESINYWKNYFDNYFKDNKKFLKEILKKGTTINIFYGDNSECSATDLESKFIESGIFNVLMHEKKNFSHGRFVNYSQISSKVNIYLKSKNSSKYESELLDYLKNDNNIIVESRYDDILCEYDLLIMSQYFIYYISKFLKIDMSKPSYTGEDMKIYFYKGEL